MPPPHTDIHLKNHWGAGQGKKVIKSSGVYGGLKRAGARGDISQPLPSSEKEIREAAGRGLKVSFA